MSYLAEVEMPERDEPELDELEVRDEIEIAEESDGVEEEPDPLPPPPQKKDKLKTEDIFKPKRAPPKKVTIDAQDEVINEDPIIPKIAPVAEKKKRKMSEKQLEALARGRAKRAANKKQTAKTAPAAQPAPTAPAPEPAPAPPAGLAQQYFTQEQVQEMIYSGVQKYDNERKKRKEIKKKQQARTEHDNKVFSEINSALNRTNDPWASAFNFV